MLAEIDFRWIQNTLCFVPLAPGVSNEAQALRAFVLLTFMLIQAKLDSHKKQKAQYFVLSFIIPVEPTEQKSNHFEEDLEKLQLKFNL